MPKTQVWGRWQVGYRVGTGGAKGGRGAPPKSSQAGFRQSGGDAPIGFKPATGESGFFDFSTPRLGLFVEEGDETDGGVFRPRHTLERGFLPLGVNKETYTKSESSKHTRAPRPDDLSRPHPGIEAPFFGQPVR